MAFKATCLIWKDLTFKPENMDVNDFKIKKSQWIIFIIISGGLLYLTESLLMSLGILLLLMVLDFGLARYIAHKRGVDDGQIL